MQGDEGARTEVRRRRRLAAVLVGALVAVTAIAAVGVSGYRIVHEPLPLTTNGGGFCGSAGATATTVPDPARLAARFVVRNDSDQVVHVDRLRVSGASGLRNAELTASVLRHEPGEYSDLNNTLGDTPASLHDGRSFTAPRDLEVPAHGALLVIADMHRADDEVSGAFTGVRVDWTGTLGMTHSSVLEERIGALAPDDEYGCFP